MYRQAALSSLFAVAVFLLLTGCGDVNITINFPAAAVEKQAAKFVHDVRSAPPAENPSADTPPPEDSDDDGLIDPLEGGSVDIGKTNKEIDEIKKRMKERYDKHLLAFYDKGNVGEKIDGYLAIRNFDGLNIKQKALLKKLVNAENADRKAVYKLVAKLNKVPDQVSKVAAIFAKKWRDAAKPDHWVQDDSGTWMKKKDYDKKKKKKK
ncbi:MAG: hypothetical protein DRP90_06240 [Planctomycetota bacterium]|nr:MAG: hypothetical protein DRP90_06240 [Planctomycetota bacterium]